VYFALRRTSLSEPIAAPYAQDEIAAALDATVASWRGWSAIRRRG
jgi:hypothetical protein